MIYLLFGGVVISIWFGKLIAACVFAALLIVVIYLWCIDLEYINKQIYYEAEGEYDFDEYTCAKCFYARKCNHAFDSYNINGDCLNDK